MPLGVVLGLALVEDDEIVDVDTDDELVVLRGDAVDARVLLGLGEPSAPVVAVSTEPAEEGALEAPPGLLHAVEGLEDQAELGHAVPVEGVGVVLGLRASPTRLASGLGGGPPCLL